MGITKVKKHTQTKVIQNKVKNLRKWVEKEIKSVNRKRGIKKIGSSPKFSYKIDARTEKIILCYTIPVPDLSKKKKYKKVHKQKYKSHLTLDDYKIGLDVYEDYEFVVKENDDATLDLFANDERSLQYWMEKYCSPIPRRGVDDIPNEKTLQNYRLFLFDYHKWLGEFHPQFLKLWKHNSHEGRELFVEYLRYKENNSVSDRVDGWNSTTLDNSHRTNRAFFNWIGDTHPDFQRGLLSGLKASIKSKYKPKKTSFSPNEIKKVLEFMDSHKENLKWYWFIPMLRVLLVSGCRISELVNMKINDLTLDRKNKRIKWEFFGKGDKERTIYIDGEHCFNEIVSSITNDGGKIRTDKEFVFHRQFYKSANPEQQTNMGGGFIERLDLPYSISGIQHKFKKMTKLLKINEQLTPHSCRRFFTLEKLRETNGDMNLVRLLLGHNSLKMVMYYQQTIHENQSLVGQRNTLDLGKVIERNEG